MPAPAAGGAAQFADAIKLHLAAVLAFVTSEKS
jgi:hypothetical protein